MSPSHTNEVSTAPIPTPGPIGGEKLSVHAGHLVLPPEKVRQVVRLIQCPICSFPLREPYTLPCGKSLCRGCVPATHLRLNISYPATANRLQGFQCPFPDCLKEHAVGDCSSDVTLNKVLTAVESELTTRKEAALAGDLTTYVIVKNEWEEAGVPSLRETETTSRLLPGGRLLATFMLAQRGELKHDAEVTFGGAHPTADQAESDNTVLAHVQEAARTEMECQVCYALFYEPVTTPCGHTFCRPCLQRVLDHAECCPVCRHALSIGPIVNRDACPSNELLTKIIDSFWADQLDCRRQAVLAESLRNGNSGYDIAIFVCALSFPSMPTLIHVYEPRYRLMVRRALERDRMFGMVLHQRDGLRQFGTILRIENIEFFPDGRSLIETVGVSRFRILEHKTGDDGYVVANIQKINDISFADEEELEAVETGRRRRDSNRVTPGRASSDSALPAMVRSTRRFPTTIVEIKTTPTSELMDFALDFVQRMQAQRVRWLTAQILTIYGECPRNPALFPWWFANTLPVKDSEKYRLLGTTSVRERLKICCAWILEWERNMQW
ncbi:ATP-dependent protease La domain-containing protein [Apodospora peruviana]|uniref:ATP-dependent protease La domain-containing protein n=1 Tax=Apodospora peruviana TaxID=516989 RepID=A0AAE0LZV7_9PEZI|nr:ATP-dependent protease La domain-containing protein [Apodospora peruviana]